MISPDLVRARRRGQRLELVRLQGPTRLEAERLAGEIVATLAAATGQSEEEIEQLLLEIPRAPSAEKLFAGLTKVVLAECDFEAPLEVDAPELRRRVFELAAVRRREGDGVWQRDGVLAEAAQGLGIEADALERSLFSDLRGARLLVRACGLNAEEVLAHYQQSEVQGVLLRAVGITLDVRCTSPDAYRDLFRKLKFRRLLHRIEPTAEGGYRIEIDGPLSLFESVTKYGLALAQLVPALERCQKVQLSADLRWGPARQALTFQTSLGGRQEGEPLPVRDEVQTLLAAINRAETGWTAELGSELFDLPGVGVVVPDLVLQDAEGRTVHLEVMGYWSRDAVFRRLEWLDARAAERKTAPPLRLLLAVSSQLRVSPDIAAPEAHGAIYVYKGTISAKALLKQASVLLEGSP